MRETKLCQVCQSDKLKPVLNLGRHALCDDLIKIDEERTCNEYPIEVLLCEHCFTANLKYNVDKEDLFPESYHYRARFTADVLNGMKSLVSDIESKYGSLIGKKVLDVGCNDGSLLSFFKNSGATTFGIEPTGAFTEAQQNHNVSNVFFGSETAKSFLEENGKMDFITFTNVFAHVEDLDDVIEGVKILSHENTKVVIENHYLGSILEKNQFDTFYHEHPRTYSLNSFLHIAKKMEMNLESLSFPSRYGGNIRVTLGNSEQISPDTQVLKNEEKFFHRFDSLQNFMDKWKNEKRKEILDSVGKDGPLLGKAFPGRAAILVRLLGLDKEAISAIAEKPGSKKIGHYVPGTKIPIISDESAKYEDKKVVLNFAWHIRDEINNYLKTVGFSGKQIDIM